MRLVIVPEATLSLSVSVQCYCTTASITLQILDLQLEIIMNSFVVIRFIIIICYENRTQTVKVCNIKTCLSL